jgi:signal transduction histidine kinase/streptogramin lyase
VLASCAVAVDSDRNIAQFAHTAWTRQDGAPSAIQTLAQTADGYLWLGTSDGLYRFDGIVFERYQTGPGNPLPSRNVRSLWALSNGDLWIGFASGGISVLRNGKATNYTVRDGVPDGKILGLAQDREGRMWAATSGGLARLDGRRWKEVEKEWNFPGKLANAVFLDREGTLWISTEETLVFLPAGAKVFQPTGIRVGQVTQIAQEANGKLWMAETTRAVRPIPLSDGRQPPDNAEVKVGSAGILFDNSGALWVTTLGDGIRRSPTPQLLRRRVNEFSAAMEPFTAKDGLSDDYVRTVLQDREGNIWVGTRNGLDRFRKTNLVPVTSRFEPSLAVLAAGDEGDLWLREPKYTVRVHGEHADVSPEFRSTVMAAYRDPSGVIWWLSDAAIYRYEAGKYITLARPKDFPRVYAEAMEATEDRSGVLWLAAQGQGLFYRKREAWQRLEIPPELSRLVPNTAFTDWMGRAWFGYSGGTIVVLDQEKIQQVFHPEDSLVGSVRAIGGRGRHTWVGGDLGLTFFDEIRFRRIIPADAEAFGPVLGMGETADGSLWLAESRGVIDIPSGEVQQALNNPSHRVGYRIFDSYDGLPGIFQDVGRSSKLIQGTDGRLWFLASRGLAWIDPANVTQNTLPPPVSIKFVKANGRQFELQPNLTLPVRTTNLQISYTALSLSVPERIHFRYKLEGVDKNWQDAGNRREAFYNSLGPGNYQFRVIASNNDGVWSGEGAHLDFGIPPAWYQTRWFLLLCIAATGCLAWTIYLWRVRSLTARLDMQFQERLSERTRIAHELHDTLLQEVLSASMQLNVANDQLAKDSPAKPLVERVLVLMGRVIDDGRNAVRGLRPSTDDAQDLDRAFARIPQELGLQSVPDYRVLVEGPSRRLRPLVRDEVYRIGREAVVNALRHSGATSIEVAMEYGAHELRVRVRDNGCGIDPQVLQLGRDGHWGLSGMRERAERAGAKLRVWSTTDHGTEVDLQVPGRIAFESPSAKKVSNAR